jgi:hypothetical protein
MRGRRSLKRAEQQCPHALVLVHFDLPRTAKGYLQVRFCRYRFSLPATWDFVSSKG